ncbi:mechanosensitive ion channel [candidate division KSB1 bacterium]|nr:mechanosensitive ion channel [candidate division KSB1 bacterium]MBL7093414.1 mechanosensitive ion channel [candidate division KSB1 bacterium]
MGKIINEYSQWIHDTLGLNPLVQYNIILTLAFIFFVIMFRFLILAIVYHRIHDSKKRYTWRKSITYTLSVIGILIVGNIWFQGVKSVATFLGIFAAGVAIALQDLIGNVAGWFFIIWRRPFNVGDRIEIAGHAGDVIDKRLFMFTLMEIGKWVDAEQSTGRVIHLPNGLVFKHSIANYSRGFTYIWNEVPVLLTFESHWEKAKELLLEIANKHGEYLTEKAEKKVKTAAKQYMIHYTKLTPIVWTSVKDSGVMLTIRYL